jgi:hypothetical protein
MTRFFGASAEFVGGVAVFVLLLLMFFNLGCTADPADPQCHTPFAKIVLIPGTVP